VSTETGVKYKKHRADRRLHS